MIHNEVVGIRESKIIIEVSEQKQQTKPLSIFSKVSPLFTASRNTRERIWKGTPNKGPPRNEGKT